MLRSLVGSEMCIRDRLEEEEEPVLWVGNMPGYGFDDSTTGFFKAYSAEDLVEVLDLTSPDATLPESRRQQRLAEEADHFCADHYIADTFGPESFAAQLATVENAPPDAKLTDHLQSMLQQLPHRTYLASNCQRQEAVRWLVLADILFAEAYDTRTTMSDSTCESGWTIAKLSSALSWFDSFQDVAELKISAIRRSLVYPLYRNFELSLAVWGDVVRTLRVSGRTGTVSKLLRVKDLMDHSEMKYLLSKLYLDDYCVWAQQQDESRFRELADALDKVQVGKEHLGFDIVEVEELAQEMMANGTVFE
eukprot:TRINITY_DN59692_c0_g1_i2.p1 TRINITY_DN59692_c0_g1~~TRINITY_DN59692_c0_g1_i2.p1  ORF type:complete len:306 (-),score=88.67 TRINITY_DN59692_c0_g1_i2:580-1497(-)